MKTILELGCGQERNTLFFARGGFTVYAPDYSEIVLQTIAEKAEQAGLSAPVKPSRHDIRRPLPLEDGSVDACFSPKLLCMALSLGGEIRRVLKPDGLNINTVRHTGDPHYQKGIHHGEDMYEVGALSSAFSGVKKGKSWPGDSKWSRPKSSKRAGFRENYSGQPSEKY